jgi:hypothetical protein
MSPAAFATAYAPSTATACAPSTAYAAAPAAAAGPHPQAKAGPRLLGLGELEETRDELVGRLQRLRSSFTTHADEQDRRRVLLEQILVEPEAFPLAVLKLNDPGSRSCGYYQVRPRMGLIGMLRGWWHVKLSSGCPLPGGRGLVPRPAPPVLPNA